MATFKDLDRDRKATLLVSSVAFAFVVNFVSDITEMTEDEIEKIARKTALRNVSQMTQKQRDEMINLLDEGQDEGKDYSITDVTLNPTNLN